MKRFALCIALAFLLVLGFTSASMATGVKLDIGTYCNDLWLSCISEETGVYSAHGYEYGCGYENRLVDGTLRVTGGYAYWGLLGSYTGFDYGGVKVENVVINLSTKAGDGTWGYFYSSGGAFGTHGGSGSYAMSWPQSPPPTAPEGAALEPDSAAAE